MVRLDELWKGNDFHRGDKMRINEVRAALKRIKEKLLGKQIRCWEQEGQELKLKICCWRFYSEDY